MSLMVTIFSHKIRIIRLRATFLLFKTARTITSEEKSIKCKTPDHSYYEQIKVCDPLGTEITYENLQKDEKENVLTELLFQSALQNITEQQIVSNLKPNDNKS